MENNCYLIDIQKLKKSKDKTGGKNAYRKKRKEKKSKGLFYLIFTLTIIAALTISCKNKATGTNEFAWEDVDIKVPATTNPDAPEEAPKYEITKANWKDLLGGKTIISKRTLPLDPQQPDSFGILYFWGEFTEDGFKWGTTESDTTPPPYNRGTVALSADFFNGNQANFTSKSYADKPQTGNIKFTVDEVTHNIEDVTVTFTSGTSYDNIDIKCGKPKEPKH